MELKHSFKVLAKFMGRVRGLFGMVKVRVKSWVMYYVYKSLPKEI